MSHNNPTSPFQAFIKNVHDPGIDGSVISFPTSPVALESLFHSMEISNCRGARIVEIEALSESNMWRLAERLNDIIGKAPTSSDTINELNYLAARVEEIAARGEDGGIGIFLANIEAGKNCGSIAEMINLTFNENLNCFDALPVHSAEDYGDILVNNFLQDEHAEAFNRLNESEDPKDRAFFAHIEKLEKYTDKAAFGRAIAKEEGGVFTEHGYLVGGDGLQQLYHGSEDIPAEHRLITETARDVASIIKIDDTNIAEAIVKLHAVGCRSMEYAMHDVKSFFAYRKHSAESNDSNFLAQRYILLLNRSDICIVPAMEVYKRGSEASKFALSMTALTAEGRSRSDIKIFAVRVNNAHESDAEKAGQDLRGDMVELSPRYLNAHLLRYATTPDRVDALHDDGTKKSYDLFEWGQMLQQQHGDSAGLYTLHYPESGLREASGNFISFMGSHEVMSHADSLDAHLPSINTLYGVAEVDAEHPHFGMIHIANEAAREILARGDADIYRLTDNGVVKLDTFEALRPALFSEYRPLAVTQEGLAGLDKWAAHKVKDIVRQIERAEHSTSKNKAEEL